MKTKILLVENEELILRFLKLRLEKENYEVNIARDGKEAIQQISNTQYSLIISELTLPFVSGFELISKIRTESNNTDTPILILSALSSENTIVDALSIGANEFLKKPFAINVLLTKIKLLLGGHDLLQAV
ncbi:MAG TPA: response regulator [Sphingobacteriaceae bacterium]|nr:response regulator [Sphingobacteriaceae bacterium]